MREKMREKKEKKTKPFCTLVVARLSSSDMNFFILGGFFRVDLPLCDKRRSNRRISCLMATMQARAQHRADVMFRNAAHV